MKIGGKIVEGPKTVLIVIPRETGDIPFKFVGVSDERSFDKLFPAPKPPIVKNVKLGTTQPNFEDKAYKEKFDLWASAKTEWYFLESIKPSNIEWDTVKADDPTTFKNWQDDLRNAGFSTGEINTLYNGFSECNMISEKMLNEARERFLASQEAKPL
jgi:hypothetical protein